jgi:hypothetical protein
MKPTIATIAIVTIIERVSHPVKGAVVSGGDKSEYSKHQAHESHEWPGWIMYELIETFEEGNVFARRKMSIRQLSLDGW